MPRVVRFIGVLSGVVACILLATIAFDFWSRSSAKKTLEAALSGFSVGHVPREIEWQLESRAPDQLARSLAGGFEVIGRDNILFSMRSYEFKVRTADGSFVACDVYYRPAWLVSCAHFAS
jgi:hypothetical protein